jgi:hypothetical protein
MLVAIGIICYLILLALILTCLTRLFKINKKIDSRIGQLIIQETGKRSEDS